MKKIILLRRTRLSEGQKALFNLICKKLKNGNKLTMEESREIYIKHACRTFSDGKPATYNYYWKVREENKDGTIKSWEGRYEKMTNQYLSFVVLQWLTHNIGSLVLKEYLKVLPIIEFS